MLPSSSFMPRVQEVISEEKADKLHSSSLGRALYQNDWAVREARARMHAASGDLIRLEKVHEALMAELTGLVVG